MVIGDFNEVLSLDKRKRSAGNMGSMEDFAQWIQEMRFIDLPLIGQEASLRVNWNNA